VSRIVLGFLGTGDYQEVAYTFQGRSLRRSRFSLVAMAQICPDCSVVVLATKEAIDKHWEALNESFERLGRPGPERVAIPSGKLEREIWQTVELIGEVVPRDSRLVLDITHGFRAQPLLAFSATLMLDHVGYAVVEQILYGAFEAGSGPGDI